MIYYFVFCTILVVAIKCDYYDYYGMNDGYNDYYSAGRRAPWGLLGGLRAQVSGPTMNMPPPFAPPGISGGGNPVNKNPSAQPDAVESVDSDNYPNGLTQMGAAVSTAGNYEPKGEGYVGTEDPLCHFGEEKDFNWSEYNHVYCQCQNDGMSVRCHDVKTYRQIGEFVKYCEANENGFTYFFNEKAEAICRCVTASTPPSCVLKPPKPP